MKEPCGDIIRCMACGAVVIDYLLIRLVDDRGNLSTLQGLEQKHLKEACPARPEVLL